MRRNKVNKTEGLEFLYLSMSSLNGSGYADKSSPLAYAESYVKYKMWKKKITHAQLALNNWEETLQFAEHLCNAKTGNQPNSKMYQKFIDYCAGNHTNYIPTTTKLF